MNQFTVGVVGLGITGSAITYELAKHGIKVVAIDIENSLNNTASSFGETRIMRVLHDSHELSMVCNSTFKSICSFVNNVSFFKSCGHVSIIPEHKLELYCQYAKEFELNTEILSSELMYQNNGMKLSNGDVGVLEKDSGYVIPGLFIQSLISQAKLFNAAIFRGDSVKVDFANHNIYYDGKYYECDYFLICTGHILPEILKQLGYDTLANSFHKTYQKTIYINQSQALYNNTWLNTTTFDYGFPYLADYGNRIGINKFAMTDKQQFDKIDFEQKNVKQIIVTAANHRDIDSKRLLISNYYSGTFLATKLTDSFRFEMLDKRIGYVFSCNGHGFKMSLGMAGAVKKECIKLFG